MALTKKEKELRQAVLLIEKNNGHAQREGYLRCVKCGKTLSTANDNFYLSSNVLHDGNEAWTKDRPKKSDKKDTVLKYSMRNYVPYCKSCVKQNIDMGDHQTVLDALYMLNRPFINLVFFNTLAEKGMEHRTHESQFGNYLKNLALNFSHLSFKDSEEYENQDDEEVTSTAHEGTIKLSKKAKKLLVEEWGFGHKDEEYQYLDTEMRKLVRSFDCDNHGKKIIMQDVCWLNLDIQVKRLKNEDVTKLLEARTKLMTSGKLNPSSVNSDSELLTIDMLIKKYENDRPIPKADPLWEDVDGIKRYIRIFFLGHLCAMMGLKNKYAKEYEAEMAMYTVKLDEDEDEDEDILSVNEEIMKELDSITEDGDE